MKTNKRLSGYFAFYFILSVSLLLFYTTPVKASQGSLEYCQNMTDKIRYYSLKRKKGGSAKSMENWKNQRKHYQEKFTNRNCKKWKDKLKD